MSRQAKEGKTNNKTTKQKDRKQPMAICEYIWEIGQTKMVFLNGLDHKVKGTISRIKESRHSKRKFLWVDYIDPRDGTKYGAWFDDQTDKVATPYEMYNN